VKINREVKFIFKLSDNKSENKILIEELLREFIDYWRDTPEIQNILLEIENNNSIYELRFNVYSTALAEEARGIIITGFGNSKYENLFDLTVLLLKNFLTEKNIANYIKAPIEKVNGAFEDIHSDIDELEDEIPKNFKDLDDESLKELKIKLSYQLEMILNKADLIIKNLKLLDDRILAFVKEYQIKLGIHKQTKFAIQKQYEQTIDSAKLLLNKDVEKIHIDKISHFREGSGYFDLGMFDDAIDEFNKALEIEPDNIELLNKLGWAYFMLDDMSKAEEYFNKVLNLDNNNILAINGLAAITFKTHNYDKSIELFNKSISLANDVEPIYFALNQLGQLYLLKSDYEMAIKKFYKAIELLPDREEAHYNLANIYYNLGLFNEAVYEYNKCLEINSADRYAEAYKLTAEGQILLNENMIDEAIEKFKEAIEKDIEDPSFYNNLGAAYNKSGDYYKAVKAFKKAIELNPNYQIAYINLGYISDKLNELDEAIKYYKKALELKPDDIVALNNLGWDLYLVHKYDEAEECYLKALKIDSHNIQALNNLGWLYIKKAEYSKALGVYQIVLEIDQNNAMAYNDIGYLYYKKNMLDKAILELNKAIRLNNDREAMTYAYYHLGLVYLKKKLKNEAIASFNKAIKLDGQYQEPYYQLGLLYKNNEEYATALKYFDNCISVNPNTKYAKKSKEHIKKIQIIMKEEVEN